MATSNSFDFNQTRNQLIFRALRILGADNPESGVSAEQLLNISDTLNVIVKSLANEGFNLWTSDWQVTTIPLTTEVLNNGTYYRCIKGHTSSASTEPGVGVNSQDYWIAGGPGTGSAWSSGVAYTSSSEISPVSNTYQIDRAYIRWQNNDVPLTIITGFDYMRIPNKELFGIPQSLWFDRSVPTTPVIRIYPMPEETGYSLHYFRIRLLADLDVAANNPDVPVPWLDMLTYALVAELSDEYNAPLDMRLYFRKLAADKMAKAKGNYQEPSTNNFVKSIY